MTVRRRCAATVSSWPRSLSSVGRPGRPARAREHAAVARRTTRTACMEAAAARWAEPRAPGWENGRVGSHPQHNTTESGSNSLTLLPESVRRGHRCTEFEVFDHFYTEIGSVVYNCTAYFLGLCVIKLKLNFEFLIRIHDHHSSPAHDFIHHTILTDRRQISRVHGSILSGSRVHVNIIFLSTLYQNIFLSRQRHIIILFTYTLTRVYRTQC